MIERQRDFNRKNKQRIRALKQEVSQVRVVTAIDVLTARYTLACYKNLEGQRRVADAVSILLFLLIHSSYSSPLRKGSASI